MKILIELPSWLGDTVMATPAIENVINNYKNSDITLIGSIVSIEAFKFHPKITRSYIIEKKYFFIYKFIRQLGKFDIFFSFRSSYRTTLLSFFINSINKYQLKKDKNHNYHQVEIYNNFINASLKKNLPATKLIIKNKSKLPHKKSNLLLGINPGASYGDAKRWSPKEFAKVASSLSNNYEILIFGGPNEIEIAGDIERFLIRKGVLNYTNLAGKTSISELISYISNLDLFITGDSGPMHLAAAFQIPTIAIFGPTRDEETSQWMNFKSVIVKKSLPCQPCMRRKCPLKHNNCMKLIKSDDILSAVNSIN